MNAIAAAISGPHTSHVRALRAMLIGLRGERVAVITIVADVTVPECVMNRGEPFLLELSGRTDDSQVIVYRQVRPFRFDGGE